MAHTTAPTVTRGYVLVRPGVAPSAVVSKSDGESMQRRFGGKLIAAKGQPYRVVRRGPMTLRILLDPTFGQ